MKKIYLIFLLLVSSITLAQNFTKGTLSLNTNESIDGRFFIDNTNKTVLLKNGFNIESYAFERVLELHLGQKNYLPLRINEETYISQSITEKNSKAVLYNIGDSRYLLTNGEVAQSFDIKKEQRLVPGILSLMFNDCNEIREAIAKKSFIGKEDLLSLTKEYNSCAYSPYTPTPEELARAEEHNTDQASFYVGIGANLNNVSFFDSDDTEGLLGGQLRAGVEASPSFLGMLQGNLFAFLEGSASFTGDKEFSNNDNPVNFSTNSYRVQLGLHFLLNKSGSIKPFFGLAVGATSDSFSGSILENDFNIDGGNPILAPRAGVRFKLKNEKHLGVLIEYITSYENDLTFPTNEGIIPLEVNNQNISVGITYHF